MRSQNSFILVSSILLTTSCLARRFGETPPADRLNSSMSSIRDVDGSQSCPARQLSDNRNKRGQLLKMVTASGCAGLMIYNNLLSAGTLRQLDERYFPGFSFDCKPAASNVDIVQFKDLEQAVGEFAQNVDAVPAPAIGAATRCELPAEMEDVLPKIKDSFRWWLARVFIAHATFAGASGMMIGEHMGMPSLGRVLPGRFLYHYLEGTGNPVEIRDKSSVEGVKEIFLARWESAGRPDSGRFFIDYMTIVSTSKTGSQHAYTLTHSLGRFFLYFQRIDDSEFELAINDLYLWPRIKARAVNGAELPSRFRGGFWHGPQGQVFDYMKRIIGPQNQAAGEDAEGYVSEETWAAFQNVGAKNFRMVLGAQVNTKDRSITPLSPKSYAELLRRIQQGEFENLKDVR